MPVKAAYSKMLLDCIIKCISTKGLAMEAQGVIAQIIVFLEWITF